jgi:5'-nucleotidase
MRILLTNDDGIDQPGLLMLEAELNDHELWTVAPLDHCSGIGQALGLYSFLRVDPRGKRKWAVGGSPTDCVKLALSELMADTPPDLVVSGINPGPNLANNIYYSGTVAAATEASFWDIPAFAVSQDYCENPEFGVSARIVRALVESGIHRSLPDGTVLNVNIPCCRGEETPNGYSWTRTGRFSADIPFEASDGGSGYSYRGIMPQPVHDRAGTDVEALSLGKVSLTLLHTDRSLRPSEGLAEFSPG